MQITLRKYTLHLKHTFRISREAHDTQDTLIVSLSLNGKTGFGEATSNSYYKITAESMIAEIEAVQGEIEMLQLPDPDKFHFYRQNDR